MCISTYTLIWCLASRFDAALVVLVEVLVEAPLGRLLNVAPGVKLGHALFTDAPFFAAGGIETAGLAIIVGVALSLAF